MTGFYRKGQMGSSGSFGGSGNPQVASVDENFSIDLYNGNQGSNQITNGVDFSTDGGLVLMKSRNNSGNFIFKSRKVTGNFSFTKANLLEVQP